MPDILNKLCMEMIDYDRRDPKRIHHFIKVHSFAKLIGEWEGLDAHDLFITEAAACVLDIGAHRSEILYGRTDGRYQAVTGPEEAGRLLQGLGFAREDIDEICSFIMDHHRGLVPDTDAKQILAEADALVRLYEESVSQNALKAAYNRIFRTASGSKICREMFLDDRNAAYKEWMGQKFQAPE